MTATILKNLNRHNSAMVRQIAMTFGMIALLTLLNLLTDKKMILKQ